MIVIIHNKNKAYIAVSWFLLQLIIYCLLWLSSVILSINNQALPVSSSEELFVWFSRKNDVICIYL